MNKKVLLMILDGWGVATNKKVSAVDAAKTPFMDSVYPKYANSRLEASGLAVGLPAGQMGNSEVGHMNIGGGRVVLQDLPRIDRAVEEGSLARNPALADTIARLKSSGGVCHLMGLLSPGGVHSHQGHMAALANMIAAAGVPVRVHAFLDGRDTPPSSARGYLERFLADTAAAGSLSTIATVSGRYYAMDRDKRWE